MAALNPTYVALHRLDPLWDKLFPAEQARIVQLLERVDISTEGADIRLRTQGLTRLVADLGAIQPESTESSVMAKPKVMDDGKILTVRVPISIRRRGGRKLVLAPDGTNVRSAPVTRHKQPLNFRQCLVCLLRVALARPQPHAHYCNRKRRPER